VVTGSIYFTFLLSLRSLSPISGVSPSSRLITVRSLIFLPTRIVYSTVVFQIVIIKWELFPGHQPPLYLLAGCATVFRVALLSLRRYEITSEKALIAHLESVEAHVEASQEVEEPSTKAFIMPFLRFFGRNLGYFLLQLGQSILTWIALTALLGFAQLLVFIVFGLAVGLVLLALRFIAARIPQNWLGYIAVALIVLTATIQAYKVIAL
jgi:hypothetical protein